MVGKKQTQKVNQRVERLYVANANQLNDFAVDVYDKSGDSNDLTVKVFVNNPN